MLATTSDGQAASPNGSDIFFQTLRQANADPKSIYNQQDSAASSATATAVAATSTCDRDVEKEAGAVPAAQLDSDASSTDSDNTNTKMGNADSTSPSTGLGARANCSGANNGKGVEILPCGAVVVKGMTSEEDRGWRKIVRNFTPSWYSVCMGTGIVSVLLHNLPYNAHGVWYISVAVFGLNVLLFLCFSAITLTRYILYPEIWGVMIKHPSQSLFLGCIPMGLSTIINMMALVCTPWGNGFIYFAWALWWVDVIMSCACSLVIPFIVVHHHRNQLSQMTAALLLPVVPVIVAAASGGIIAGVLPNNAHAVTTIVTSYILWSLGETFSFFIMTVYFLRLQVHDLPPREVIVSVFLPIGPLGQGGFAIQQLGKVAITLLPATGAFNGNAISSSIPDAFEASAMYGGTVLYMFGILAGLCSWGAALGWLAFAVISIMTTKSFPFNMGWWGFVFPLGVLTSCTSMLATELSSTFFKVITMIFSGCVFCLWILVAVKTAIMAVRGDIFFAPCLRNLPPKEQQANEKRSA
ncbi:Plasma membrane sulfite pump involved in sulfite metabolism [Sporothrix epigloea]|uniref:Plasma membrane sulfite pump involved in sulfite metabolism n=1 Tax=Sporothrix epigloea TaxID=1892477 RepID=A0ABP0DUR1_9PEZI